MRPPAGKSVSHNQAPLSTRQHQAAVIAKTKPSSASLTAAVPNSNPGMQCPLKRHPGRDRMQENPPCLHASCLSASWVARSFSAAPHTLDPLQEVQWQGRNTPEKQHPTCWLGASQTTCSCVPSCHTDTHTQMNTKQYLILQHDSVRLAKL